MSYRRFMRWILLLLAAFFPPGTVNCLAQETVHDHSCTIHAAGIFSTPAGEDGQNFNHGGWGFQVGGGFAITRQTKPNNGHAWYVTVNYLYDKFRVRESALVATIKKEPQLKGAT